MHLYLQLTWADIAVANYLDTCIGGNIKVDQERFKPLIDLMKRVFEIPNIKSYVATRPKTLG